jgi:hypothetical protein
MSVPVSLITLSRDNPEELAKTLASVMLQSVQPDTYLVLDSSTAKLTDRMKQLAESAGATYVWTPPEGIYAAMRKSIDLIPADSYSWWINSSDWLVGRASIHIVKRQIAAQKNKVSWLVGQLIRLKGEAWAYHASGVDGEKFLSAMKTSRIGFPHPSTIFWTPHLKQVKPYDDNLTIASDYATALRFGENFGPPHMSPSPLSLHVPNGISVQKPLTNVLEKSHARRENNSRTLRAREPLFALANVVRGSLQQLRRQPGGIKKIPGVSRPLGDNLHFCGLAEDSNWPMCCDEALLRAEPEVNSKPSGRN